MGTPIIFITYYLLLIMKIVVLDGFAANPQTPVIYR